jgi:hypothetical protein
MTKSLFTTNRDTPSLTAAEFHQRRTDYLAALERRNLVRPQLSKAVLAAGRKCAETGKYNTMPVICTDFEPPLWFPTISLAAQTIGARAGTLWVRIRRGTRCRGYRFKYDEKYRSLKMGRQNREIEALKIPGVGMTGQRIFEGEFIASCIAYAEQNIAFVEELPLPTVPAGMLRRVRGKSAYDYFGYTASGKFIAIELKSNAEHTQSLKIREMDDHGDGIQYHQLAALDQVARKGGIALIIWSNGGAVGVLGPEQIMVIKGIFDTSVARKRAGKDEEIGTKSVKWGKFRPVNMEKVGTTPTLHWLKEFLDLPNGGGDGDSEMDSGDPVLSGATGGGD